MSPNKEGTFVYSETVNGEDFLIILFVYNFSRDIDLIKMSRVRPHKSFIEEQMLGKDALGIIEAFEYGNVCRYNIEFLDYHKDIISKEIILEKYPEYCI